MRRIFPELFPTLAPALLFRMRWLAALAVLFCGVNLCLRLALPLAFSKDLPAHGIATDLLVGLLAGLVNDLAPLCFSLLLPATIMLALSDRFILRRGGKLTCWLVMFLYSAVIIFSTCAEYFFWDEFHARFNFIAVDYLIYTTELIRNAIESYPLGLILPAIALAAALASYAGMRLTSRGLVPAPQRRPLGPLRRLGLLTCLYGVAALTFFFFTPVQVSQDRFHQEYTKNGVYEMFSAFRHNQLDYRAFYRTMDSREAFTLMRTEYAAHGTPFVHDDAPDLVRAIEGTSTEARPNVILVIMESMGSKWLEHSPNLRALAENGLSFSNMLSTGTRTVRGIEALMLSVPPTPGNSIVRRPDNANLFTLGSLFRERGYDLSFIYGGLGYFDNMNAFFSGNGYHVVDKTDFAPANKTFSTAWGQCDEDLFNESLRQADASHASGKLFQQVLLTTSNHRPFTYPEGKVDVKPGSSRTGAVKYSDYAIGRFMDEARTKPWFDNTVFVFVGDHPSAVAGKTEVPADAYGIVSIIYGPAFFPTQKVDTLCSQIDVAPTLLARLGWSYRSQFFGENALEMRPDEGRAWISTYLLLGFRTGNGLTVLDPHGRTDTTPISPEGEALAEFSPERNAVWRQKLEERTVASYQCAYDLFVSDELKETFVLGREDKAFLSAR